MVVDKVSVSSVVGATDSVVNGVVVIFDSVLGSDSLVSVVATAGDVVSSAIPTDVCVGGGVVNGDGGVVVIFCSVFVSDSVVISLIEISVVTTEGVVSSAVPTDVSGGGDFVVVNELSSGSVVITRSVVESTGDEVVKGGCEIVVVACSAVKSPEPNSVTPLIDTSVVASKAGVVSSVISSVVSSSVGV